MDTNLIVHLSVLPWEGKWFLKESRVGHQCNNKRLRDQNCIGLKGRRVSTEILQGLLGSLSYWKVRITDWLSLSSAQDMSWRHRLGYHGCSFGGCMLTIQWRTLQRGRPPKLWPLPVVAYTQWLVIFGYRG